MAKLLLSILISLTLSLFVNAQPDVQWQRCLGGSRDEEAYAIKATSDGGHIVVGSTTSQDGDVEFSIWAGSEKMWVVKLNAAGEIAWQMIIPNETGYGVSGDAYSVIECADKGFLVVGITDLFSNGPLRATKLTANGVVSWNKVYGGLAKAFDVVEVPGDGYLVVGQTSANSGDVSGNHGSTDAWLLKLDANGTKQWQKCLGGSKADGATSVRMTTDNGFIISGWTYSKDGDVSPTNNTNTYNPDAWLIKTDSQGAIQWQRCLGNALTDKLDGITITPEGNYVAVGFQETRREESGTIDRDAWVVSCSPTGDILMQNIYGGTSWDRAAKVINGDNGDLVIVGSTSSNNGQVTGLRGNVDTWVFAISSIGTLRWQKCLGGSKEENGYSVSRSSDGGYIVAGNTQSTDKDASGLKGGGIDRSGGGDFWVVKLGFAIPSITTGDLAKTDFCLNSQLTIPFYASSSVPSGTTFQAELSNATGDFSRSTLLSSTNADQPMAVTIPGDLPAGTAYKIRVKAVGIPVFTTTERTITIATQTPIATFGESATILKGQTTTLTIRAQVSTPWMYTLSSGQTGQAESTTAVITVSPVATTQYIVKAITNACGTGTVTGSPTLTVLKYCFPTQSYQNDCQSISDVILRNSQNTIVWRSQNQTCQQAYSYTEGNPPTLLIGNPYQLQIGRYYYSSTDQHVTVWIDVNQDSTFTDNEILFQTTSVNYLKPSATGILTLPDNARIGFARMRIRSRNALKGIVTSACDAHESGETEDYLVYLTKSSADLSVTQKIANRVPGLNDWVDVTLTIRNDGPDQADGIVFTEQLPNSLSVVDAGDLMNSSGKLTANVNRLENNQSTSLHFRVKPVAAGQYYMAGQITASKAYDPDSPANSGIADGQDDSVITDFRTKQISDSVFTSPTVYQLPLPSLQSNQPVPVDGAADISLQIHVDKIVVKQGEVFRIAPRLRNNNPQGAYVKVIGQLPDGLELVKSDYGVFVDGKMVTYNSTPVDNYKDNLLPSMYLRAKAPYDTSKPLIIKFQVTECSIPDQDSVPGNGYDTGEDDSAQIEIRVY